MIYLYMFLMLTLGCSIGVVTMSMMFIAKDADRRLQTKERNKANCHGGCKGWNVCDEKW